MLVGLLFPPCLLLIPPIIWPPKKGGTKVEVSTTSFVFYLSFAEFLLM